MHADLRDRGPRPLAGTGSVPMLSLLSLLFLLLAAPVSAQRADFLFGRPAATVAFVSGWAMPGESSDLFAETREDMLMGRGDFATAPFMVEVGVRVRDRVDIAAGFEYAGRSVQTEWRDYVWQDDSPILQTAAFRRWRLMAGLKAYILPRGRSISEYAWVPRAWAPYVAAGAGVTWYEFTRRGDFVYEPTLDIFEDRLESRGHGVTPYAAAGMDISLSSHFLFRAEVRQLWGSGGVDPAVYEGYNDIDLSGLRATFGFAVRMGERGV